MEDSQRPPSSVEENEAMADVDDDLALVSLIAAHRQPDDGSVTHLSLPGLEYLSEGDVRVADDSFQNPRESRQQFQRPPVQSTRVVHMDLINQELIDAFYRAFAQDDHSSRFQTIYPRTGDSTTDDEEEEEDTAAMADDEDDIYFQRENEALDRLEALGVPPLYPRHQMHSVRRDPARFEALLRPFYFHPPMDCTGSSHPLNYDEGDGGADFDDAFFQRQELRWRQFRRWQANNRGVDTTTQGETAADDAEYEAAFQRHHHTGVALVPNHEPSEETEAPQRDGSFQYSELQLRRERELRFLREQPPCETFREYQRAVKERLLRHGFQVLFTLEEVFFTQDRLTTWIEYLGFEYWWLEQYKEQEQSLRQDTEDLFQELQRNVRLQSFETIEWLRSSAANLRRRTDHDRICMAHDRAVLNLQRLRTVNLATLNQANRPRARARAHANALRIAQIEISILVKRKEATGKRLRLIGEFVHRTSGYHAAQQVVKRHAHLINWVLENYGEMEGQEFPERAAAAELARMRHRVVSFAPLPGEEPMVLRDDDAETLVGRDTATSSSSSLASTDIITSAAAAQRSRDAGEPAAVFRSEATAERNAEVPASAVVVVEETRDDAEMASQASCQPDPSPSPSPSLSDGTTAVDSPSPPSPRSSSQQPRRPNRRRSVRVATQQGVAGAHQAAAHASRQPNLQAQTAGSLVSSVVAPSAATRSRRRRRSEMSDDSQEEAAAAGGSSSSRPAKRPRLIHRFASQRD